ncbi:MAG: leucine-rich repeat domain-containing protein [Gemmataceae bacterium]
MIRQRSEASGRRRGREKTIWSLLLMLGVLPSCRDLRLPNAGSLFELAPATAVLEGEATLGDGDDTQVSFKTAFQSPPRVTIVELRQSKFDKKPFASSDFHIVQVESTYFKIQNKHSEQRLGSWATVKWRAVGIKASENQEDSISKSGALGPTGKLTQEQIIARIKRIGGTVAVYPLSGGAIIGVDLHRTAATDADLERLQGLSALRTLNLYGTHITDAGLKSIGGLAGLQVLYLNETAVTDAGLAVLQGLTHLTELGLHGTHVTDEGIFYLRNLVNLQSLTLSGAEITDRGLLQLKVLHDLKKLVLSHTSVTASGVQELKSALPRVQVIR